MGTGVFNTATPLAQFYTKCFYFRNSFSYFAFRIFVAAPKYLVRSARQGECVELLWLKSCAAESNPLACKKMTAV
jgi:hypothetical protein